MQIRFRVRELALAIREFLVGVFVFFRRSVKRRDEVRYCFMCQEYGHPLTKVSFMIRTEARRGAKKEAPFSVMELHVCSMHHPDKDVVGADLSEETRSFFPPRIRGGFFILRTLSKGNWTK